MIYKSISLLIILNILLSSSGCNRKTNDDSLESTLIAKQTIEHVLSTQSSPTPKTTDVNGTSEMDPPIAIVSIEDQTLMFECVDRVNCISNINLDSQVHLDLPYELGPVLYWNPTSIYLILYSDSSVPLERNVLHLNPQTGEIKSTMLSSELNNLHFVVVDDRLIFAEDNGNRIHILSSDLSIENIKLDFKVNSLVSTFDHQIIALDEHPVEVEGVSHVNISIVNVFTGLTTKEQLPFPNLESKYERASLDMGKTYLINIEGISRDLRKLYCLYFLGSQPNTPRLGTFNIDNSNELVSTSDPEIVRITSGYAQYHEMLYTSNSGDGYGVGASLVEMSGVESLLDFKKNPDWKKKLIINPFGEQFLLGSASDIYLLSPSGEILKKFPLPNKWIGKSYKLMYFMN